MPNNDQSYKPVIVTFGNNPEYSEDINPKYNEHLFPGASTWTPSVASTTNIQLGKVPAIGLIGSYAGIPQVNQIGQSLLNGSKYDPHNAYATAVVSRQDIPGVKYQDFRSWKTDFNKINSTSNSFSTLRLDGTQAASRKSVIAGIYAAAATSPAGAYSVFNLDGVGKTGFGLGDHDNPYALRNDFTAMSHITTKWKEEPTPVIQNGNIIGYIPGGKWLPTKNLLERVTPFRGDKVTVIDFGKRTLKEAYLWKPKPEKEFAGLDLSKFGITQDFIKFYFTGPKLYNGVDEATEDNIMVFRATINRLSDNHQPQWTPQPMIGRGDPNYHFSQVTRDIQLDFTVFASSRDELKPIWRKLNALAGYTAPEYDPNTIALKGPWLRFTIGDLFVQQPAIVSSLSYTLHDETTSWEINIEQDPEMMQVPHKVNVSITLTPVMDYLPQLNGKFYTLANKKQFLSNAETKPGTTNWLSDFNSNKRDLVTPNIINQFIPGFGL